VTEKNGRGRGRSLTNQQTKERVFKKERKMQYNDNNAHPIIHYRKHNAILRIQTRKMWKRSSRGVERLTPMPHSQHSWVQSQQQTVESEERQIKKICKINVYRVKKRGRYIERKTRRHPPAADYR
jgi:hypothetical protein